MIVLGQMKVFLIREQLSLVWNVPVLPSVECLDRYQERQQLYRIGSRPLIMIVMKTI